ncbi:alpha/beta fold hydrolase [Streptomyces iakyrus]|uniref:alpha/beta fold hydrolase n=1 Tax=Streptomyces iakyrus TaxID=68219 RepID=UPI0036E40E04
MASCYWGDRFGATLSAGGRSVPGLQRTRGAADDLLAVAPPDREAAEWALLLTDPLCEVRVLAEIGWDAGDDFAMPGVRSAGAEVLELLSGLPPFPEETDELGRLLRDTDLYGTYPQALTDIAHAPEATRAAGRAEDDGSARELAVAAARAVVAAALAAAGADADCTGDERDRLVDLLTARLGGDARGVAGRAGAVLGNLALYMTTQPALNLWRGPLTTKSTPFLGDILRYQARGAALRDLLHEEIAEGPGPTVLIGHSLGGIALVDLLALAAARGEPVPGVELVVTVGSQAPFLYELGALTALAPGEPLPAGFPRWLNIYDRQDLLAFMAEPVFPADPRVTDHEVSSRQPFLPCHSAYWKLDAVYDRIAHAVAEIA